MFKLTPIYIAWLCVFLGMAWGVAMDKLAQARRPHGDRADYWCRVAQWCLYPLVAFLALSELSQSLGGWSGFYAGNDSSVNSPVLLLAPFIFWSFISLISLFPKPLPAQSSRWLTGGVGFANSRRWLLWQSLILAVIVFFNISNLEGFYPVAVWGCMVVSVFTLLGISFSGGRFLREDDTAAVAETQNAPAVIAGKTWPELMKAAGFIVRTVAEWPATPTPARNLQNRTAQAMSARLEAMGAMSVAQELIEAVASLACHEHQGSDGYGAVRVVFAPDNSGQIEAIALMALLLDQQSHTVTLIVTPLDANDLAKQLQSWLPDLRQRIVALDYGDIPEHAVIWVVNAELLSDSLLRRLKDLPSSIAKVGLVVWWRLHDYSGVMAANLWAITRRLHRLLRTFGREDLLTLAFMRTASADAQYGEFVRHLLPHSDLKSSHTRTYVKLHQKQRISLHILQTKEPGNSHQYLLLSAAAASIAGKWPTAMTLPDFISADEFAQFCGQTANTGTIGGQLLPTPSQAAVGFLQMRPADLLALPNLLGQGRQITGGINHFHIAIMSPDNPYVAYLLNSLAENNGIATSRRLICAKSCPAIIQRHLLLGLNELPDTRDGLLQNSLWDSELVDETLVQLAKQGKLSKVEVRYLDANGRLALDFEYRSHDAPDDCYRPLDTIGLKLIKVRERAGGGKESGIRMHLDQERLLIMAYPGRVFMYQGKRYRISEWSSVEEVKKRGELECRQEGQSRNTWRCHSSTVFNIKPLPKSSEVAIGKQGRLQRLAVELHYEEEVTGRIEWTSDPCQHWMDKPQRSHIPPIANKPFVTRAVILRLMVSPDANALHSLCQALQHVLPVHLGVEDNALAVVNLNGENDVHGEEMFGIAIVDLYPGGIGVVEAVSDDDVLWLNILHSTSAWLEECQDDDLQNHPIALAANADQLPQAKAALKILKQIL
ncbi:hypothetical protein [Methylovulum psychrotolerans]|uniref:Uncharacterized protein n=1 Tax=Methylovulum psychrotolerans TaxID=1704499 RepID=A0A1Z4C286_9GAMM|nr:hypothetical protein [Methylovulum psychrotolerans]ASF47643.1 hypothetical protein CEK71_17100 [Methylovulum psychrotolerans]